LVGDPAGLVEFLRELGGGRSGLAGFRSKEPCLRGAVLGSDAVEVDFQLRVADMVTFVHSTLEFVPDASLYGGQAVELGLLFLTLGFES
jgi:hypothetical protein